MVGSNILGELFCGVLVIGLVVGFGCWGLWEIIDCLWVDDTIRVSQPIVPTLELVVKNNVIDTIYVYRP